MRGVLTAIAMLVIAAPAALAEDAGDVVARMIEAHNARDLDGFLETLSEDVVFLNLEGQPLVQGRDAVAAIWGERFAALPDIRADILHRAVIGDRVVDHEILRLHGDAGEGIELVAIYTVEQGRIVSMHVIQPQPSTPAEEE